MTIYRLRRGHDSTWSVYRVSDTDSERAEGDFHSSLTEDEAAMAEICATCGLRYGDHDGREQHRFSTRTRWLGT